MGNTNTCEITPAVVAASKKKIHVLDRKMKELYTIRAPLEYFRITVMSSHVLHIWSCEEHYTYNMKLKIWKKLANLAVLAFGVVRLNDNLIASVSLSEVHVYNIRNDSPPIVIYRGKFCRSSSALVSIDESRFAVYDAENDLLLILASNKEAILGSYQVPRVTSDYSYLKLLAQGPNGAKRGRTIFVNSMSPLKHDMAVIKSYVCVRATIKI
jgi:hypothetical protein